MNEMKMQLLKMILSDEKSESKSESKPEQLVGLFGRQIVIAQRGWVFVGLVQKSGVNFVIKEASVIRNWGTTKGLGELAENGPIKDKTILDTCPDVTIHELSVVARIDCMW